MRKRKDPQRDKDDAAAVDENNAQKKLAKDSATAKKKERDQ